jgi:hypothetical protein
MFDIRVFLFGYISGFVRKDKITVFVKLDSLHVGFRKELLFLCGQPFVLFNTVAHSPSGITLLYLVYVNFCDHDLESNWWLEGRRKFSFNEQFCLRSSGLARYQEVSGSNKAMKRHVLGIGSTRFSSFFTGTS